MYLKNKKTASDELGSACQEKIYFCVILGFDGVYCSYDEIHFFKTG
jgi:hypothetical protein